MYLNPRSVFLLYLQASLNTGAKLIENIKIFLKDGDYYHR
jgi:hypothetical protein